MTLLTEAMNNVISPYIPARPEWLDGWCGPAVASVDGVDWDASLVAVFAGGCTYAVHTGHGDVLYSAPWPDIRLDLTRPEVRDLLIRRGAPAWARDIPAALWVWAVTGSEPEDALGYWRNEDDGRHRRRNLWRAPGGWRVGSVIHADGWVLWDAMRMDPMGGPHHLASGPDTGDAGREAADRAALAHGCILAEPGGYIGTTPTGPGWWPKEQA